MSSILEERIKLDCDFDSKIYDMIRLLTANESKVDIYANVVKTVATFNNSTFLEVQLDIGELESKLLNIIGNEEEDDKDSLILKMDYEVLVFLKESLRVYGVNTYPVNELLGIDLICNTLQTLNIIYTLEEGMESIVKDYCESLEDDPDAFCTMLESLGDRWKEDYLTVVESVDPELKIRLDKWLIEKEAGTVSVVDDELDFVNFAMKYNLDWLPEYKGKYKYIDLVDYLTYANERKMFNNAIESNIPLVENYINYAYKKGSHEASLVTNTKLTSLPAVLALTIVMSKLTDTEPTAEVMFRQGNSKNIFNYLVNVLHLYDFSKEDEDESITDRITYFKETAYLILKTLKLVDSPEGVQYDSTWFYK